MSEELKCETSRLYLIPSSFEEMSYMLMEGQRVVLPSALDDIMRTAIASKIGTMRAVPKETYPWFTYWKILRKKELAGEPIGKKCAIGLICCKGLPDEEGYTELGYRMSQEMRRQGYMKEAILGLLDWLYEFPFCRGAYVRIRRENTASIQTVFSCGFVYEKEKDGYQIYRYTF